MIPGVDFMSIYLEEANVFEELWSFELCFRFNFSFSRNGQSSCSRAGDSTNKSIANDVGNKMYLSSSLK